MSDDINNIEHIKAAVLHGNLDDACLGAGIPAAIAAPAPLHVKAAVGLLACASGVVTNAIYNFGKEHNGFVVQEIKDINFGNVKAPHTPSTSTEHSQDINVPSRI